MTLPGTDGPWTHEISGRASGQPLLRRCAFRASLPAMPILVNRAPVLTPRATVVAERLGHLADTALTLGRAVAGSAARVKARSIGREERTAVRDADTPRLAVDPVTAPVLLPGKTIRLLPTAYGEVTSQPIPQRCGVLLQRRSANTRPRCGRRWRGWRPAMIRLN